MELSYNFLKNLSQRYGDSFYLLDIGKFVQNYKEFLEAFKSIYPNVLIAYSYKTNYIPTLCKIVDRLGGLAEVVSEMEYDLAIKIGVNPHNIIVNGPYKPKKALEKYLNNGSLVNIDSCREFKEILDIVTNNKNNSFRVGLRINFDIKNLEISRFGIDINSDDLAEIINKIKSISNLHLECIHCHLPNRDLESFREKIEKILAFINTKLKILPKYIDIGGGFAGRMDESLRNQFSYEIPTYKDYAEIVASKFYENFRVKKEKPFLVLEPGTAIVADTMKFVCQVYSIKNIRGKYIATTSGSRLNFLNLCSSINLPIKVYSENKNAFFELIDIAGYTCIEADYLYKGFKGFLSENDFLVFDNVGSYSIVFKPPFILPNVPILGVWNDEIVEIKRRETVEDVFNTFNFCLEGKYETLV